jgi:hypothetical protein
MDTIAVHAVHEAIRPYNTMGGQLVIAAIPPTVEKHIAFLARIGIIGSIYNNRFRVGMYNGYQKYSFRVKNVPQRFIVTYIDPEIISGGKMRGHILVRIETVDDKGLDKLQQALLKVASAA